MQLQANSRHCFLCGLQNDVGLKMRWYADYDAQRVTSTVTIPEHFNGYPGVVHGGIVAAMLDETAGRAVMLNGDHDDLRVTLKLNVTYRQPTPTQTPLTISGWVLKQRQSRAQVAAEIRLADGTVTAECTAVVVRPPEEFFERWEAEKQHWHVYPESED